MSATGRRRSSNERKHETWNLAQRWLIRRFHRRICDLVEPLCPRTVLDVGCGEGYLDRALIDRLPSVSLLGIDVSETALVAARRRCPEARFREGLAEALGDMGERYDVVLCSEVLEHLPDPTSALRNLARHTLGHAVLTVPWEPWYQIANLLRGKYLPTLGSHPEHIHRWTVTEFVRLVRGVFVPVTVDTRFPWTIVLATSIR